MATWHTIGFDGVKKFFERLIKAKALSHAYLFTGQEMIGKKTFALELAARIVGAPDATINPDVIVLEPEGVLTIEQIRNAKLALSRSSYYGGYKALVIDEAHQMTDEAQNAILKLLEEPTASTVIMLVTHSPDGLLATIRSRCQEVEFSPHPRKDFDKVFAAHDAKLSSAQKDFLFSFSNGRLGLVQQIIAEGEFRDIKAIAEELAKLSRAPLYERLAAAQALGLQGKDDREELQRKVLYWILYMHTKTPDPQAYATLQGLLDLHRVIGQTQFNAQTAVERFVIGL